MSFEIQYGNSTETAPGAPHIMAKYVRPRFYLGCDREAFHSWKRSGLSILPSIELARGDNS